jgi:hypothetical protein
MTSEEMKTSFKERVTEALNHINVNFGRGDIKSVSVSKGIATIAYGWAILQVEEVLFKIITCELTGKKYVQFRGHTKRISE